MPWIDARIKQFVKKKLNLRACKFKDPDVMIHYNRFRTHVQRVLRVTSWKYVSHRENDILKTDIKDKANVWNMSF